jgi:hypothetical protein
VLADGEPMYRWALVPAPPEVPLDLYPENIAAFATGARLLGLGFDQPPQAGREWPVTLVWQVAQAPPAEAVSFSLRLVGEQGEQWGQADGPSLAPDLWRAGDTVFNRFSLPVAEDYPGGAPLEAQAWMYGAQPAGAVDDRGFSVAPFVSLRPAGAEDQQGWFRFNAYGRYDALTSHLYLARLAGQIDLLSFDAPRLAARPGEALPLTLYWKAAQPPGVDYRVFVHLIGPDGGLRAQSDKVHPAGFPATHWPVDRFVVDRHMVSLPPGIAPGEYQLLAGLWDEATGQRAAAVDESGAALGDGVRLPITITIQP